RQTRFWRTVLYRRDRQDRQSRRSQASIPQTGHHGRRRHQHRHRAARDRCGRHHARQRIRPVWRRFRCAFPQNPGRRRMTDTRRPPASAALRRTTPVKKAAPKTPKPTLWQLMADHPVLAIFFGPKTPDRLEVTPPDPWPGSAPQGRHILNNVFAFAGQKFPGDPAPWKIDGASPDFQTALHGFEWLRDLRALGGDAARLTARSLVRDWLQHHKRWDAVAWKPDTVG